MRTAAEGGTTFTVCDKHWAMKQKLSYHEIITAFRKMIQLTPSHEAKFKTFQGSNKKSLLTRFSFMD
jgi:hypothetical protein